MIIYYKELNWEPSTYEPYFSSEENKEYKEHSMFKIISDFKNEKKWVLEFKINKNTKIFLNKNFILQIELKIKQLDDLKPLND